MNILLTVEELAKYLKIKPDTIYKKVRRGELPAIKLGKLVRFPKEAIDQWLGEQANKTMKEVRAARQVVEAKMEETVVDLRKRAKAATKVLNREVPEMFEEVKNAPLSKKQETLTKGLRSLWKGLNENGVVPRPAARRAKSKSNGRANGKSSKTRKARRRTKAAGARAAARPESQAAAT